MKILAAFMLLVIAWSSCFAQELICDHANCVMVADSITMPASIASEKLYLVNRSDKKVIITSTGMSSSESTEFKYIGSQLGYSHLTDVEIARGDSIWFFVAFVPDYSRLYPWKFADRHAIFSIYYFAIDSDGHKTYAPLSVDLRGVFNHSLSVLNHESSESKLRAYVSGRELHIDLADNCMDISSCALFDILGRKVSSWRNDEIVKSDAKLLLTLPSLSAGAYFLRVHSSTGDDGCRIVIQ